MIQLLGIIVFALLLYLGQKYVYAKIWQRDLKVSLSFREDGIWEGQESELSEIIENRKRLPLTMLKVKFQTDRHLVFADTKGSRTTDRYYRNDIFQIGRLEKVTRALHFTGGRRGYYTIQEADLVASDLFLTAQYTATTPIEHCSLYVYPKPFSHPDFKRSLKQLNGEVLAKRHLLEDPFEYRGIRDYQPQDDLKSINWKATGPYRGSEGKPEKLYLPEIRSDFCELRGHRYSEKRGLRGSLPADCHGTVIAVSGTRDAGCPVLQRY